MNAALIQRFIGIDVAHSGKDVLIQEHSFNRSLGLQLVKPESKWHLPWLKTYFSIFTELGRAVGVDL